MIQARRAPGAALLSFSVSHTRGHDTVAALSHPAKVARVRGHPAEGKDMSAQEMKSSCTR